MALDADEFFDVDDFGGYFFAAVGVVDDLEAWVVVEANREEGGAVVVEEGNFAVGGLGEEALEVGVAVGGAVEGCEDDVGVELAEFDEVVVVVVGEVEGGGAVDGGLCDGEYLVGAAEFAEVAAGFVHIEALDALVEPYLAGGEGGDAFVFEVDGADGVAGEDVAHGLAAFDGEGLEVEVEGGLFEFGLGDVVDGYDLGLAVGIGGEVEHFGATGSLGEEVFAVAGDGGDAEAFDHDVAVGAAVAVDHVVDGALVALAEDGDEEYLGAVLRADEAFFLHFGDDEGAVAAEGDDVVEARAFAGHFDAFLALEAPAGEAGGVVDVELLVGEGDGGGLDVFEGANLGAALAAFTKFF